MPLIEVQNFVFRNVKVNYDDQISTTKAVADVNDLGLVNLNVDLTNSKYSVDDAHLNKSNILFAFKPVPGNDLKKVKDTVVPEKSPLGLIIKNISLADNDVQFDNLGAKPTPKGMDFNHLKINQLNLGASDVSYSAAGIKANVKTDH